MTPIPISSCQHCDPDTWVVEREAKYAYRCKNCGRIIYQILKKEKKDE